MLKRFQKGKHFVWNGEHFSNAQRHWRELENAEVGQAANGKRQKKKKKISYAWVLLRLKAILGTKYNVVRRIFAKAIN